MRQELEVLLSKPHWVYFLRIRDRRRKNKNGERIEETVYGQAGSRRAIGLVEIDLLTGANPARTYLHELTHRYYPDWTETQVIEYERDLWHRLNQEERFEVYAKLFKRRFKGKGDIPP